MLIASASQPLLNSTVQPCATEPHIWPSMICCRREREGEREGGQEKEGYGRGVKGEEARKKKGEGWRLGAGPKREC